MSYKSNLTPVLYWKALRIIYSVAQSLIFCLVQDTVQMTHRTID